MNQIKNIRITETLAIIIVLILAIMIGNWISDEYYYWVGAVLSLFVIIGLISYGKKIYLLIPLAWELSGSITILPIPLNVRQIIITLGICVYISSIIFKNERNLKRYDRLDVLVWIYTIYLVLVFIRNPVGINALGTDLVGGKPYIDVSLGILTYFILRNIDFSKKQLSVIPFYTIGFTTFNSIAGFMAVSLPGISLYLIPFYSNFSASGMTDLSMISDAIEGGYRLVYLQGFGYIMILYVCAKIDPTKIFAPGNQRYIIIYLAGLAAVLFSGFRSTLFTVLLLTCLPAIFRSGFVGLAKVVSTCIVVALFGILASYSPIKLPQSFQRSLSFLPGNWDQTAVADAKGSTDWRVEMWMKALTEKRYIRNKVFGDGFGYLRSDFERMVFVSSQGGYRDQESQQEDFLNSGQYHSGPVSSIKRFGYLGGLFFLFMMIMTSIESVKIIKMCVDTEYSFISFFFLMPAVLSPIIFIFIFGDFTNSSIQIFFDLSILKLIRNSFNQNKYCLNTTE